MYQTASTTKSFTAAAISLLIDDSANSSDPLKWTTPISSLIRDDFVMPDEYATTHVTLEDAASHRTGMPRHDFSYGQPNATIRDMVRNLRNLPMTAEIRTKWQYCNMMFVTLAYVVETLTGMWLGDFLRIRIWEPLSMSSTYFSVRDAKDAVSKENKTLATPYIWDNSTRRYIREEYTDGPQESGDGAIVSNVLDYSKYLRAMIDMAPPMSPGGHTALRTPRSFPDNTIPHLGLSTYALGWEMTSYSGEAQIYHGGSVPGFATLMLYLPERKWGTVMMANASPAGNMAQLIFLFALLDKLQDISPERRFDWKSVIDGMVEQGNAQLKVGRAELYPNAPKDPIPLSLPLQAYAGTYTSPGYGTVNLTIDKMDDQLPSSNQPSGRLCAAVLDRAWPMIVEFEHVSGEYFLGHVHKPMTDGTTTLLAVTKAEFKVNEAAQAAELGILIEPAMGGDLIWFRKNF